MHAVDPVGEPLGEPLVRIGKFDARVVGWIAYGFAVGIAITGGLALLVRGPARDATALVDVVELPEVRKPVELPYPYTLPSMCAMGDEGMSIDDEALQKTCTQIRKSQLKSAQAGWVDVVNERRISGDRVALIEATLIVARTFVDHAIVIQHLGPEDAARAAMRGKYWAGEAASMIDPGEGHKDPRVSEIATRAKPLLPHCSQHSPTPSG